MNGPAIQAQLKYLEILFRDCNFSLREERDFLLKRFNVKYTDDLTYNDAWSLVTELRALKQARRDRSKSVSNGGED